MSKDEVKHILVPLDVSNKSRKLIDKAIQIAKQSDAKITGVNVVVVKSTLASAVINYKKYLTKKAEEELDSIQKYCEKQGVEFTYKILYGSPGDKILEFAENNNTDLIVMDSHSRTGLRKIVLGSVANTIVQKSKVSVLVVK